MVSATEEEEEQIRRSRAEYFERMMTPWTSRCDTGKQKPYCGCDWHKRMKRPEPVTWGALDACSCGEEEDLREWKWQKPPESESSWVVLSENNQLVMFHPTYSSGTAAVKGDTPLQLNCHYYWEIKMLTDTYGTDIMVGLGSAKFDHIKSRHKFCSLLGKDKESYGISYTGKVQHNGKSSLDTDGFCKGTIVGLRLDMWQGTLEFYINRQSECVSFYHLRRHSALYPVVCSTAAQSCVKLVYAASWRASLLVDALKMLAASTKEDAKKKFPPGLCNRLKSQFWLTMPSKDCLRNYSSESRPVRRYFLRGRSNDVDVQETGPPIPTTSGELVPYRFVNGFDVDNQPYYRMVLWDGISQD